MTKVGENKSPGAVPDPRQEVSQSSLKFQNALESYQFADGEDKLHLKAIMDEQLQLIRSSVREIKRTGIAKQEQKVEDDYQKFLKDGSSENFAALEHDIQTLRDYLL